MISVDEINKLQAENKRLNDIIDSYQPRIQALKDENFELKESLKCFQKPEVVKVLTDWRTGEIDNLKTENERLKEEIKEYKKRSKCAWKCFEGTLCEEGETYKQENKELAHYLACMTEQRNKANTCLQEIKKIANHWQNRWWNDIDERQGFDEIIDLITKAEEE